MDIMASAMPITITSHNGSIPTIKTCRETTITVHQQFPPTPRSTHPWIVRAVLAKATFSINDNAINDKRSCQQRKRQLFKSNANPESFDECWRGGEPDEAECQSTICCLRSSSDVARQILINFWRKFLIKIRIRGNMRMVVIHIHKFSPDFKLISAHSGHPQMMSRGGVGCHRSVTCYWVSRKFLRKKRDMQEGGGGVGGVGVKKSIFTVTPFVDDPFHWSLNCFFNSYFFNFNDKFEDW